MKHKLRALLSGLLASALLLSATSCSPGAPSSTTGVGLSNSAMGRYVEEEVSLPEGLAHILYLGLENGTFTILGYSSEGTDIAFGQWVSTDGGESWQLTRPDLGTVAGSEWLSGAAPGPGGSLYTAYRPGYTEEEAMAGNIPDFELALVQNGEVTTLPHDIDNAEQLILLPGGELLATYNYGEMLRFFNADGKKAYGLFPEAQLSRGHYALAGDTLAVGEGATIQLYDLYTGQAKTTIEIATGTADRGSLLSPASDTGEDWYYANAGGIYKVQAGGALAEKLLDGGLTSLSLPNLDPKQLLVEDGGFYILFQDQSYLPVLYRYTYDETVPTTPDTLLRVYSLEENATIRLAANLFQRQYPSVQVSYEYGYTPGSGQTADDALKALATQLVAGTGPDVLVMDGLPLESYIGKGVLLELGGLLGSDTLTALYQNIALGNTAGGGLYTIAARFTMPMLFAKQGDEHVFDTPETLANYLTGQAVPAFGRDAEHFIETLYPLYASRWLAQDGTLHTATLREDLIQLKRITDLYTGYELSDTGGSMYSGALLAGVVYPVVLAELRAISELEGPFTNMVNGEDFTLWPLPSAEAPVFIPRVNLAIAAASTQTETAALFIACTLGEEVQRFELGDGLPVHRAAMQNSYQPNPNLGGETDEGYWTTGSWGWTWINPFAGSSDTEILSMFWPDEAFFERYALWETATSAQWDDRTLLETLENACTPYLLGGADLDDALTTLERQLSIMAAENS